MENLTISEVSRQFDVTPRMLRHYEKLGLICPTKREDYAYRVYDGDNIRRLKRIIILRKLRIPLKRIAAVLRDDSGDSALAVLRESISELDGEISSLEKVREILAEFIKRLGGACKSDRLDLLGDDELSEVIDTLTLPKTTLKEKYTMSELDKANEVLNRPENVRILRVPAYTVASYHFIGEDPEGVTGDMMTKFAQMTHLYDIKPDARLFGFNHPNPGILENGLHGYEFWLTIPDDMEVPEPYVKKHFEGGLYAVLTMRFPEFERWNDLHRWVQENDKFTHNYAPEGFEIMGGCLEEHLNWLYDANRGWVDDGTSDFQLDLLMPIKLKGEE